MLVKLKDVDAVAVAGAAAGGVVPGAVKEICDTVACVGKAANGVVPGAEKLNDMDAAVPGAVGKAANGVVPGAENANDGAAAAAEEGVASAGLVTPNDNDDAAPGVPDVANANAAGAVDVGPDALVRGLALVKLLPHEVAAGGLVTSVLVGAAARVARAGAGAAGRGGGTIGAPGCSSVPAPFISSTVWLAGTSAAAGAENDAPDHSPVTSAGEAARGSA